MSKISIEHKKGKTTIINKLAYPESVNERVYNAIISGVFEGFIPVTVRQKRKETRVECVVQGLISLEEYFNGIVTKKMFLDTVYQTIQLLKNCEKNMVSSNNLDLQCDLMFLDPQTKTLYGVYWPIVNNQREKTPQSFFKSLADGLVFSPHEDGGYLEQYKAFFAGVAPFSIRNFERLILKLQGKKASDGHAPSVDLKKDQDIKPVKEVKKNVNIEYDPFAQYEYRGVRQEVSPEINQDGKKEIKNVFKREEKKVPQVETSGQMACPSCGKENPEEANYCMNCMASLKVKSDNIPEKEPQIENRRQVVCPSCGKENPEEASYCMNCMTTLKNKSNNQIDDDPLTLDIVNMGRGAGSGGTTVLGAESGGTTVLGDDSGGTTVLGYDEPEPPVFPMLTRLRTEETFVIDKPSFRIGTEKAYCDLFISDNTYISRSHADIITRDERYYILDQKSTNKTYVDGKVIPVKTEVEIFSGTEIRLANEDFVFTIEA